MADRSIPEPHVTLAAKPQQETIIKTEDVFVRVMPLTPHESTEPHHHTEVTDTIVCLTGHITVQFFPLTDTGTDTPNVPLPSEQKKAATAAIFLAPGERYTIPPFTRHAVSNMQDVTSEYLLIQGVGRYDFITE